MRAHDYEIKTERLLLRPMTVADADAVWKWVSDASICLGYQCLESLQDRKPDHSRAEEPVQSLGADPLLHPATGTQSTWI